MFTPGWEPSAQPQGLGSGGHVHGGLRNRGMGVEGRSSSTLLASGTLSHLGIVWFSIIFNSPISSEFLFLTALLGSNSYAIQLTHLKYNSVALSIFPEFCDHQHNPFQNLLVTPKGKSVPTPPNP